MEAVPDLFNSSANVTSQGNVSDFSFWEQTNWTIPEGCIKVMLSQLKLLPGRNPDSIVSVGALHVCKQIRPCMLLLLFLIGGPANLINMVVFYKQGLKDRVTLLLFFLALSDGIRLTASMIFQAEDLYKQFIAHGIYPLLAFVMNNNLMVILGIHYASVIFTTIIAVERCLCVFNPLKAPNLIRTRTMALIIALVYIFVYSLSFPMFLRYAVGCLYDPVYNIRIKTSVEAGFYKENEDLVQVIESIVFGVVVLGGSVIVVAISTMLTIVKLRQIRTWRSESSSFSSRDESLTIMLVASSILYVISKLPMAFFFFVRLFFPEVDHARKQHNFFLCTLWTCEQCSMIVNACNIFVYYTMGSRYRETFWAVFGGKRAKTDALKVKA